MQTVIDLTVPRLSINGTYKSKSSELRVRAGDIIKAHSGSYIVTEIKGSNGKLYAKIMKSGGGLFHNGVNYMIVETSQLHNIDSLVKDGLSSATAGAVNPVYGANEKYFKVKRQLADVIEENKGVVLPESFVSREVRKTDHLPAFNQEPTYGIRYVIKDVDKKEDNPVKNQKPNEKVEGKEDKEDKPTFEGNFANDTEHNVKPVPDPTAKLAPTYNELLYPYGREPESAKTTNSASGSGVSEDAVNNEAGDIQNG